MNEQIQELLKQVGVTDNWNKADWYSMSPEMIEKFADMIVKECIAQCESQNTVITTEIGTEAWGEISDAVEQIKKHFYGVEE
jgi:hypothetical protein